MNKKLPTRQTARSGFTLLELMVVIVIIAILMSLILPVLSGVLRRGDVAAVQADIKKFEVSLAKFKEEFGAYPPSSFTIPASATTWDSKSRATINRFWPQFDFVTCGGFGSTATAPGAYPTTPVHLNGAECLVFFLGGVDGDAGATPEYNPSGFSDNPLLPWAPATVSQNRTEAFFEFEIDRIQSSADAFVYMDPIAGQTTPYLYLSGSGRNIPKTNGSGADSYDVNDDATDLQQAYTQGDGKTVYRNDAFQLISPGEDGAYGPGGPYADGTQLTGARRPEADNITNFSSGTLN